MFLVVNAYLNIEIVITPFLESRIEARVKLVACTFLDLQTKTSMKNSGSELEIHEEGNDKMNEVFSLEGKLEKQYLKSHNLTCKNLCYSRIMYPR